MKVDKRTVLFLFIIAIIGLITGALYMTILNSSDKTLITNSLNNFLTQNNNNEDYIALLINNLIINLICILGIWILGISMIGLPIAIAIIFYKSFILSFSLATFIANYKIKGAILGLVYNFPHQIIILLVYIYLGVYAIKLSLALIDSVIKKKNINFKHVMNRYILVALIAIFIVVVMTLFETFVMPIFLQKVRNML